MKILYPKSKTISIIGGAGHIGLPLSIMFSEKKYNVNIIDINLKNLKLIQSGKSPFQEKNIEKKISKQLKTGRLSFSKNISSINESKFIILCIGTPILKNLKPDLKNFYNLIKKIKLSISKDQVLIIRSSILPGTTKTIMKMLNSKNSNISYCPERIVEGKSFEELPNLPQIISSSNLKTLKETSDLFKIITKKIIICDFIEAELSKIFSNLYRYINFAIPNEMYLMARKFNADFGKIRNIMIEDYPRNKGLAKAGFVGGPCLMKDTMQMSYIYKIKNSLANSAYKVNENLPKEIVNEVKNLKLNKKVVGVLGLTFKPDSDDLRGSLAMKLLNFLKKNNFEYYFSDPFVKLNGNLELKKLIKKCNVLILATNHSIYKNLKISKSKKLIDLSGMINS